MSAQQKTAVILLGNTTQCLITYFGQGNAARFLALVAGCGALTAVHFSRPADDFPQPPKAISHPSLSTMIGQQKATIFTTLGMVYQGIVAYHDQDLAAQIFVSIATCVVLTAVCFILPAGDDPPEEQSSDPPGEKSSDQLPV